MYVCKITISGRIYKSLYAKANKRRAIDIFREHLRKAQFSRHQKSMFSVYRRIVDCNAKISFKII